VAEAVRGEIENERFESFEVEVEDWEERRRDQVLIICKVVE